MIVGKTTLQFLNCSEGADIERYELQQAKETLNLMRSYDSGVLKNKRLVGDLLRFCDVRRPACIGFQAYNDMLSDRVRLSKIPGMGQFDIDGLTSENQQALVEKSSNVLGYVTIAFFIASFTFGTVVIRKIFLPLPQDRPGLIRAQRERDYNNYYDYGDLPVEDSTRLERQWYEKFYSARAPKVSLPDSYYPNPNKK